MSQIKIYNDIFDFFPASKRKYSIGESNIPDLTLVCLESYILEYKNADDYLYYINNELNKLKSTFLKNKNKKVYLCIATRKNVDSSKVIDYYKVWRTVKEKYIIDSFNLGDEIKIKIDDEILYASCAEVAYEHLDEAIAIIHDCRYRSRAFIYITPNETMLLEDSVRNLFEMVIKTNISLDFISLYSLIQPKDVIINFINDGEMIDLLIVKKQENERLH